MSLENIQARTNGQRVAAGNVSASNDPSQWQHDGKEQLIKGAELASAGRILGLSEEETLAAVSRQYRRQARVDSTVTPQDVMRQMAQASATTREEVGDICRAPAGALQISLVRTMSRHIGQMTVDLPKIRTLV